MSLIALTPIKKIVSSSTLAPNAITGLTLWLDGNDPAGTGTPPSNGANVASFVDKSTTGANFSASATNPTFAANVYLSTKGALLINNGATTNFSNTANTLLNTGNPATVVLSFQLKAWQGSFDVPLTLRSNDTHGLYFQLAHTNTTYQDLSVSSASSWLGTAGSVYKWSGITTGTWYVFMWTYNGSGATTLGNFAAYLGNVAGSASQPGGFGAIPGTTNWIGTDNDGDPATIYLQQLCIYNKVLSSTEQNGLYSWLTTVAS